MIEGTGGSKLRSSKVGEANVDFFEDEVNPSLVIFEL
jgi:hypothetical protein